MDPASTQQGQMLPPSRRPYKRISSQQWEDQKDRIRELFIKQNRTYEDVVRILKESHDFDVG
jgi:Clr5 domain